LRRDLFIHLAVPVFTCPELSYFSFAVAKRKVTKEKAIFFQLAPPEKKVALRC
jgi:hypothetical protein